MDSLGKPRMAEPVHIGDAMVGSVTPLLEYWHRELKDAPKLLQLPTDRPRSAGDPAERRSHPFVLRGDPTRIHSAVRGREPVLAFFAAVMGVLLFRYSEQEDMTIGVSSRDSPEWLPLRVRPSRRITFLQHVTAVIQSLSDALAHRGLSMPELLSALGRAGTTDWPGLFQVAVTTSDALPHDHRVDVAIRLETDAPQVRGVIEYNPFLFDAASIARMSGHLETLAEAALMDSTITLGRMPLLSVEEMTQIVWTWNETGTDLPAARCLHECFEGQVARAPDAPAILSGEDVVSYRVLNERANHIANHLLKARVTGGELVGIFLGPSVETVAAILGVLKSGCAYVPMDPAYPKERLTFMLQDTNVRFLVTCRSQRPYLPPLAPHVSVLVVEDMLGEFFEEMVRNPDRGVHPDDLSYVIYTSGSTGTPKGIQIRHGGVSNNIADLNQRFDVWPRDRILAISSLSFDMSVYEILGALAAGAAIVLPDATRVHDPEYLASEIERQQVTIWNSAPALLKLLLDALIDRADTQLASIRLALLGGDWIPVTLPGRLRAFAPRTQVVAMGGSTEASIHSTIYVVDAVDPTWGSIPYGRPMANQRVYVLDSEMQPVPVGVPGELYLGGVGVGYGYLNRAALSREKFLDNPFLPGERMFRTGDCVRFLPDGNLMLLGRLDLQVKVHGFRIDLGEIETILEQSADVDEATAVVREDVPGERGIVAFVVPRHGSVEPAALRAQVSRKLPDYMIPAAIVVLDALPLSPNGKVDRKALSTLGLARHDRLAFAAPSDEMQRLLIECWQEVLRIDRIGVHENFFSLGGDSVSCIQAATMARRIGVQCSPNDIFRWPTVATLSAGLRSTR